MRYSGKKKAHTRKTLVVVNERGRLRYVSPSAPGATHDLTLLRPSGALEAIPADLSLRGDSGFQGLQNDAPERSVALPYTGSTAHPLTPEQKLHNALLSRIRIVVENTLAAMKHFRILAAVFRHSLALYDSIVVSIAGVVTRWADRGVTDQRCAALPVAAQGGCLFRNKSIVRVPCPSCPWHRPGVGSIIGAMRAPTAADEYRQGGGDDG